MRIPGYTPTLSLVTGRAGGDVRHLPPNANGVLMSGLAEQVQLLQQSVASVARTLEQLRATGAQAPQTDEPAQAGGME